MIQNYAVLVVILLTLSGLLCFYLRSRKTRGKSETVQSLTGRTCSVSAEESVSMEQISAWLSLLTNKDERLAIAAMLELAKLKGEKAATTALALIRVSDNLSSRIAWHLSESDQPNQEPIITQLAAWISQTSDLKFIAEAALERDSSRTNAAQAALRGIKRASIEPTVEILLSKLGVLENSVEIRVFDLLLQLTTAEQKRLRALGISVLAGPWTEFLRAQLPRLKPQLLRPVEIATKAYQLIGVVDPDEIASAAREALPLGGDNQALASAAITLNFATKEECLRLMHHLPEFSAALQHSIISQLSFRAASIGIAQEVQQELITQIASGKLHSLHTGVSGLISLGLRIPDSSLRALSNLEATHLGPLASLLPKNWHSIDFIQIVKRLLSGELSLREYKLSFSITPLEKGLDFCEELVYAELEETSPEEAEAIILQLVRISETRREVDDFLSEIPYSELPKEAERANLLLERFCSEPQFIERAKLWLEQSLAPEVTDRRLGMASMGWLIRARAEIPDKTYQLLLERIERELQQRSGSFALRQECNFFLEMTNKERLGKYEQRLISLWECLNLINLTLGDRLLSKLMTHNPGAFLRKT